MSYYYRKLTRSKWNKNTGRDLEKYSADTMTSCIRTAKETLSIWTAFDLNFDNPDNQELIVALALSMQKPDTIGIVLLFHEDLTNLGLELEETVGKTIYQKYCENHRDIVNLNYQKLGIISKYIVNQLNDEIHYKHFPRTTLINMVVNRVKSNIINIEDLPESWKLAVEKKLS